MDLTSIIAQVVGGVVGGHAAGNTVPNANLGGAGNTIAGAIGGIILAQIVQRLTGMTVSPDAASAAASSMDIGTIVKFLISSGVGGALLTAIIGMIKNRTA